VSAASQEKIAQQLAEVTRELGRISGADPAADRLVDREHPVR
jgi:hypothetical protein